MHSADTARLSSEAAAEASPSVVDGHTDLDKKLAEKDNQDPNIVDWDGANDSDNPRNWSRPKKNVHIIIVSLFALCANLAATMFAPGAQQLADDFRITDPIIEAFTVNIYLLGFGIGPVFLAPLSELYGRLVIYHFCNTLYLAFTIGCTFSTNTTMFLIFRLFAGLVASGPLSIGGGTIADITPQEERGKAVAIFSAGPLLGPVIGPIIGGFVTQAVGWRWTFRIILILAGLLAAATILFMRETNATVLLQRKTERLVRETGNSKLTPKGATSETPRQIIIKAIVRPVKMLIFSPIVLLLSLYGGTLFGIIFLLFTTFPVVFEETYGFNTGIAGLAYLGLGLGFVCGLALFALLSDKLLNQKKDGTVAQPEQRLILMKWLAPIAPLGCFLYGWAAEYHIHWIVPIIGTFIVGLGSLFVVIPIQTYLVDAFGAEAAASALAANLIVRSPFGALLVLAAPPLYAKLGLGWGNSTLGFIALLFTPLPWLFYNYGESLRNAFPVEL
ncbi:major facilitator superfamily domain-containing protein [Xylariaceae sp. FL1651]|nr:major facilitator superfamily domain-containing protein [Xylariaceae sp. FL1651]